MNHRFYLALYEVDGAVLLKCIEAPEIHGTFVAQAFFEEGASIVYPLDVRPDLKEAAKIIKSGKTLSEFYKDHYNVLFTQDQRNPFLNDKEVH